MTASSRRPRAVLSGSFGMLSLPVGSACAFRISPSGTPDQLFLTSTGLAGSTAYVCPSADCSVRTNLTEGITSLPASAFPAGVWLYASTPTAAATIQFTTLALSCSAVGETPLLLSTAPTNASDLFSAPTYSLCVTAPNLASGVVFSWGWSLPTLPASFNATGFYALVKPFDLALPAGEYDIAMNRAVGARGVPMTIRLMLTRGSGAAPLQFTAAATAQALPAGVTRGAVEFFVPPGTADQAASIIFGLVKAYAKPPSPPSPPPPPRAPSPPFGDTCRPASSPRPVTYNALFATASSPFDSVASGINGTAVPSTLTGGCAFAFPAATPDGNIAVHHLHFTSSIDPTARTLAWFSGGAQRLLSPGDIVTLPAPSTPTSLAALLSGDGSYSALRVEHMAELESCVADNTIPVTLRPTAAPTVGLTACSAIPNLVTAEEMAELEPTSSLPAGALLDFSFGWDMGALPTLFTGGFTASAGPFAFPTDRVLPRGWYNLTLLPSDMPPFSSINITLDSESADPMAFSLPGAAYIARDATAVAVTLTVDAPAPGATSVGVRLRHMPSPPPPPPQPPSPPTPPPRNPLPPSPKPPRPALPSPAPLPPSPQPPSPAPSPLAPSPSPAPPAPSSPSPSPLAPAAPYPPSPINPSPEAPHSPPPAYPPPAPSPPAYSGPSASTPTYAPPSPQPPAYGYPMASPPAYAPHMPPPAYPSVYGTSYPPSPAPPIYGSSPAPPPQPAPANGVPSIPAPLSAPTSPPPSSPAPAASPPSSAASTARLSSPPPTAPSGSGPTQTPPPSPRALLLNSPPPAGSGTAQVGEQGAAPPPPPPASTGTAGRTGASVGLLLASALLGAAVILAMA
ncbi:hypothetical protein HYH03_002144 [Edaphochlamys debaryana]|uniref:Uncharacterized protein n=1 Tax=Edaphochlamys debaryana TaxID=47281 RepID=A0A835YEP9_9CHLO|nr:hypothetical protein HYH03_002144 [Edaphochlamys debaryana]|eukprot:KAG2499853.1 hypothetical protein HYH03_002144 [Edaphochlamys debaryana]